MFKGLECFDGQVTVEVDASLTHKLPPHLSHNHILLQHLKAVILLPCLFGFLERFQVASPIQVRFECVEGRSEHLLSLVGEVGGDQVSTHVSGAPLEEVLAPA